MCMSETRQNAVEMRPCDGHRSNQQWKWKDGGSSTHLLVNYALGKCVEAEGDQHYVSLKECNNYSAQQHWRYISGSQTIFNPDSGKVLDVRGAEQYIEDATGVIIWDDNDATGYANTYQQRWYFMPSGDARKFQEGVDLVDAHGGISASLACVSTFAMLAVLLAACALRSKWSHRQNTEDFDTLLTSDEDVMHKQKQSASGFPHV